MIANKKRPGAVHEVVCGVLQAGLSEMKTSHQCDCNPVGFLQELAEKNGWHLPQYTVTQESGPGHLKSFTLTCRVKGLV